MIPTIFIELCGGQIVLAENWAFESENEAATVRGKAIVGSGLTHVHGKEVPNEHMIQQSSDALLNCQTKPRFDAGACIMALGYGLMLAMGFYFAAKIKFQRQTPASIFASPPGYAFWEHTLIHKFPCHGIALGVTDANQFWILPGFIGKVFCKPWHFAWFNMSYPGNEAWDV